MIYYNNDKTHTCTHCQINILARIYESAIRLIKTYFT